MTITTDALLDFGQYPIDRLDTAEGQGLVAACRSRLAADGAVVLPSFLSPLACAQMAAEANASAGDAFFCENTHNVYLGASDDRHEADHPRNRQLRTVVGSVAYDRLGSPSTLRTLYGWDPLVDFVRQVLGLDELHRLADPLGACSINVFRPGDMHAWHFDEAEYTTTIMLQEADTGGFFEYVPRLRAADGSEVARVGSILDGDESAVQRLDFRVGSLSIFGGRQALHRVTPIEGSATRLVAVLTFNSRPGVVNSEAVRTLFWGRSS